MKLALDLTTIAALRSIMGQAEPDPVEVALIGVRAGAEAIGISVKGERSHVGERDCVLLRDVLKVPFVLKISTSTELAKFAVSLKPPMVVLQPERREDLHSTTASTPSSTRFKSSARRGCCARWGSK